MACAALRRSRVRRSKGDLDEALEDYNQAVRLKSDHARAFYNRAMIWKEKGQNAAAIADLQKYLGAGGGARDGDTQEVEKMIRDLSSDEPKR